MTLRSIWLADHRGRNAVVVLVPRRKPESVQHQDGLGRSVRHARLIKATDETCFDALRKRLGDAVALARALIDNDPEIDLEAVGRETGPCDRVYVDALGKPLYSARFVEVVYDSEGNEVQRRAPVDTPSNLLPNIPPVWSGKLIPCIEAARRFAFTRAYQVRHANALEFDFLCGLATHLEKQDCMALVGSGPRGIGPLLCERNALPMKGFLEGRTRDESCLLILHLAAFELKRPEMAS
jgi:hypothetical protein